MNLEGQIALVTGGAHRLGKAVVLALGSQGCDLVVHYNRAGAAAEDTARAVGELGRRAIPVQADLSRREGVKQVFAALDREYGDLNILVNSAAVLEQVDLLDVDEGDWQSNVGLNLKGAYFCLQEAAIRMRDRGGGGIVNISDTAGQRPWERYPLHSISKAGLEMLTQVAAKALAPEIRVNAVVPGPSMKPSWMPEMRWSEVTGRIPVGQAIPSQAVADAVVFLLRSDYITGHSMRVDGGSLLI